MLIGMSTLAGCCVAFGVLPQTVLQRFTAPAASALLHADAYSHAVLTGSGSLPTLSIDFDYTNALELVVVIVQT